jgi:hypothetical protein
VKSPSLENLNQTAIKKASQPQSTTTDNTITVTAPKIETKQEYGDFCFNDITGFDVKISIYKNNSDDEVKTINVTANQTSCVYELPNGIYRIELVWQGNGKDFKKETKEIRIKAGKSDTIELHY